MKQFTITRQFDGQRAGHLKLRSGLLETPAMFYGHYPSDPPFWRINGRNTPVVINAYHIWMRLSLTQSVRIGVRNYLNSVKCKPYLQEIRKPVNHLGPVLFDSGGYSFMNKAAFSINQPDILNLQESSKADIAITLDWPIDPDKLKEVQRWKHLDISIKNAEQALDMKTDSEMLLMPVVHGWNRQSIKYSVKSLLKVETDIGRNFDAFSIGSVVPHSFRNIEKAIELLLLSKRELPSDRPVHVLGLGGLSTIPIVLALGVDMFDSSTYVLSAIDHWYFLPNFKRVKLNELKEITCRCPVCRNIKTKDYLLYPRKEPLSLHNFFILEKELKMLVKSIHDNTLHETINKRIAHNKKLQYVCKKLASAMEKDKLF